MCCAGTVLIATSCPVPATRPCCRSDPPSKFGGRWSAEAASFVRQLALPSSRGPTRAAPPAFRAAYLRFCAWSALLAFAEEAFAANLLSMHVPGMERLPCAATSSPTPPRPPRSPAACPNHHACAGVATLLGKNLELSAAAHASVHAAGRYLACAGAAGLRWAADTERSCRACRAGANFFAAVERHVL